MTVDIELQKSLRVFISVVIKHYGWIIIHCECCITNVVFIESVTNKVNGIWNTWIWKQLSFLVNFRHNVHSTKIKLAFPDYKSRWSSNSFNYFYPRLPDVWPNVFTLQTPCCKTELFPFKLQVSSKHIEKMSINSQAIIKPTWIVTCNKLLNCCSDDHL